MRHDVAMTGPDRPHEPGADDVLSSLPRARPQRRSSKRGDANATGKAQAPPVPRQPSRSSTARKRAPARSTGSSGAGERSKPAGVRPSAATTKARGAPEPPPPKAPPPATGIELVETAVAAAGELARIGLSVGARALRNVASRLPRP